jgi:hypothetical protein
MTDWISTKDLLPSPCEKVLAYDTQRIYIAYRGPEILEYNEHWTICNDCACNGPTGAITHWQKLPEAPK